MEELSFDRWQWEKKSKAVSTDSELSFNDYSRMSTITHEARNPKFVPAWALNDVQTRAVVLEKLFRYARSRNGSGLPAVLAARASCDLRALEKCAAVSRARLGLFVRIIYLSYRTRRTSPQVGAEVGITPVCVRVILQGLNKIARELFPDDCNPPAHDPYAKTRTPEAAATRERRIEYRKAKAERRKQENQITSELREPKKQCTPEELSAARTNRKAATLEKNFQILRTLTKKHAGVLPGVRWLRLNGYEYAYCSAKRAGLLHLFQRHPRAIQFRLITKIKGATQ